MDQRIAFDAPVVSPDGRGGTITGWTAAGAALVRWGAIRYLRGGERVIGARLEGVQPAVITVRRDSATRRITPEWRLRRLEDGAEAAIRAIVPTEDRAALEITCEFGVAP